jgi:hypothetical protein
MLLWAIEIAVPGRELELSPRRWGRLEDALRQAHAYRTMGIEAVVVADDCLVHVRAKLAHGRRKE